MLSPRSVGTASANIPVPESALPPPPLPLRPPGVIACRAGLRIAMVPVLLCSYVSFADASPDLRCFIIGRSRGDPDESCVVPDATKRKEDYGLYGIRGCIAVAPVQEYVGYVSFSDELGIYFHEYRLTSCAASYGWNADDLVNDFVSLTPLVTKESLQALEASYNQSQGVSTGISFPQMQAAASRFLGRLWAGSNSHNSAKSLNLNPPNAARPESTVRRSPSKQSMASTLNSMESASSEASTAATEVSTPSGGDSAKMRTKSGLSHKDKDLHGQIEDLLMALGDLQREQAELARELQREREEREEDHEVAKAMLAYIKDLDNKEDSEELIAKAEERFAATSKRVSIMQTKHQLRDEANRWKEKHDVEAARCLDLTRRIDEFEIENARLKEDLREARQRIQDGHRDRQRLERTIQELRHRKYSHSDSTHDSSSGESSDVWPSPGLREIKLVSRAGSQKSNKYPKRNSSLGLQSVPGGESQANNNAPAGSGSGSNSEDALLLELVNAKTAEAVAKQELEEVKAKLDSLRRLISNQAPTTPRPSVSTELSSHHGGSSPRSSPEQSKASTLSSGGGGGGGGGFFGWGKRTVSTASFS